MVTIRIPDIRVKSYHAHMLLGIVLMRSNWPGQLLHARILHHPVFPSKFKLGQLPNHTFHAYIMHHPFIQTGEVAHSSIPFSHHLFPSPDILNLKLGDYPSLPSILVLLSWAGATICCFLLIFVVKLGQSPDFSFHLCVSILHHISHTLLIPSNIHSYAC